MTIYKMILHTEGGSLVTHAVKKEHWSLVPDDNAKIVISEEKCTEYNKLYAVKLDTTVLSVEKLLNLMFTELNTAEVKKICDADKFVEKMFLAYLSHKTTDRY